MNREEFMRQLEGLLQNISPAERAEALQYYNDYFDDAGQENEQSVIESLGTPARVAENIKRDMNGSGYGESAYQRTPANGREIVDYQGQAQENCQGAQSVKTVEKESMPAWGIVLIVILCVLASPALLGMAGGLLGIIVGLLAAWFALIFAFGVAALALMVSLIAFLVVGVICMFTSPLTGIGVVGVGLAAGGFGILFMMLTVAMAGIATPAIIKGLTCLCKKIFKKKEAAA